MKHAKINGVSSEAVAYLHGRIEHELEGFASSLGVPTSELTSRVGTLLLGSQGRSLSGPSDRMPSLRRQTSKRGKTARKVAVDGRPYRRASKGPASYWAKMTKAQRQEEMKRRAQKRKLTLAQQAA